MAAKKGMEESCLPFSGKVAFIRTESYWLVNHMVSEKEKAVSCTECHTSENSRLAGLNDFYMPGRDRNNLVEFIGIASILMSLLGVTVHGSLRFYFNRKNKR